jgi:hypothetical protein
MGKIRIRKYTLLVERALKVNGTQNVSTVIIYHLYLITHKLPANYINTCETNSVWNLTAQEFSAHFSQYFVRPTDVISIVETQRICWRI